MYEVKVFIRLPEEFCLLPWGKGSYGHVAMEIPRCDEHNALYISLGPKEAYANRNNDNIKYSNHDLTTILVPLSKEQLLKMHGLKNTEYEEGFISHHDGEYETPPSGYGPNFSFLVNPIFSRNHNCTSIVIGFLKEAGVKLAIGPLYTLLVFGFNTLNGGIGGYCIGVLSHLCDACKDNQLAEELGLAGMSVAIAFVVLSFISYTLTVFANIKCPSSLRSKCCNFNPFFLFSTILLVANSTLTVVTGYFHSQARTRGVFDKNEKIAMIVGIVFGLAFPLFYHCASLYKDSFNYFIRPNALLNNLLKQGYSSMEEGESSKLMGSISPSHDINYSV